MGRHVTQCGEAYPHAKFYLDPSNRLATNVINRSDGQDRQDRTTSDSIVRTVLYNRSPESVPLHLCTVV